VKERGILYQGAMVRALLANTKTQTRRAIKAVGKDDGFVLQDYGHGWRPYRSADGECAFYRDSKGYDVEAQIACPYGQPGDQLWVREAWSTHAFMDATPPRDLRTISIHYWADGDIRTGKRRPGMFMPRRYSRILLEVTEVRVERLQDISEADALAEGIVQLRDGGYGLPGGEHYHVADPRESYFSLWRAINGAGSVEANPWVWAVSFRRLHA